MNRNKTELIEQIENLVDTAHKFKNAYFWTPPTSAGERRSYERYYSISEFNWNEGGADYSASYEVTCTCRYIYTEGRYYKDGKKTNLTAIKNSLKRLKTEAE